jgi:PknH-like protein
MALSGKMRRRWLLVGAVVLCVAPAGIGWWIWSASSESPPAAVAGTAQASVLGADEVSRLVGVTLTAESRLNEPPPSLKAEPANCAVAVGPSTQSAYTRGWTSFLSVTYEDSDDVADHSVTQVLGVYPDAGKAAEVFRALADGVRGCAEAVRTDGDQEASKWAYQVRTTTSDALAWTAVQDSADDWACHRQARLKGNTVLQVSVCQAGDGQAAAREVADQFAARVRG